MDPFLIRAFAAGIEIAILAAPLGCFVVWQRMAYFGEAVAQASLIGIALGLAFHLDLTASALAISAAMALVLIVLARQSLVPLDSLLGLLAHAALALGVIAASLVQGPTVDLLGYLFGDILPSRRTIFGGSSEAEPSFWWRSLIFGSRCCLLPFTRSSLRQRAFAATS